MIQIAVLGYGTVGSGVVEVINRNQASINKNPYVLPIKNWLRNTVWN